MFGLAQETTKVAEADQPHDVEEEAHELREPQDEANELDNEASGRSKPMTKPWKPHLVKAAFTLSQAGAAEFVRLCNDGNIRQAEKLLEEVGVDVPDCRFPVCKAVLSTLRGLRIHGSIEVVICDLDNEFEAVYTRCSAQQLILSIASLHFDDHTAIMPVLVKPRLARLARIERPLGRSAGHPSLSVRIFTLEERSSTLEFLGKTTSSVSHFLERKDTSEWASNYTPFLLNSDKSSVKGIVLSRRMRPRHATSFMHQAGGYPCLHFERGVLFPSRGVATVFILFAWSVPARQLGSAYVLRMLRASGFTAQLGPEFPLGP